jgi:L-ascorbate metabolism protein UlaG (beta-lactamase superfamily)
MENKITFINHATVLLQLDGFNIITDPIYSLTLGYYFPRLKKPGIPFKRLPTVDFILLSHHHHDHLNMKTLRRFARKHQSVVLMPKGIGQYARRAGFDDVIEMNWWEKYEVDKLKITCVPAKHSGKRVLWEKKNTLFCGFVVETINCSVYFAGDTAYDIFFKEMAEKFSLDVALLPIGAYKPYNWFKDLHLNPQTAVQAFLDLRAKYLIPIHWGTFKISDEPMGEPPFLLKKEAERVGLIRSVYFLNNGESFSFSSGGGERVIPFFGWKN